MDTNPHQKAIDVLRECKKDPIKIAQKLIGVPEVSLWDGVREMIGSIMTHRKTAVQAGHAMSKDWTAGLMTLIWLLMHWNNGKVIITAPKMEQVKSIIFKEIEFQYLRLRAKFPEFPKDAISTNKLYFNTQCWALGMTTKEGESEDAGSNSSSKFSGFHSPNILIIISESQGVEPAIYKQIRGLMTSPNSRLLEIGNPVLPFGNFFDHCMNPQLGYNVIHLPVSESPNIKAGREVVPGMVSREWLEEFQRDLGPEYEQDPEYQIRALALFPQQSSQAWIPLSKIRAAINKKFKNDDKLKVGGADVAGPGSDETVFCIFEGSRMLQQHTFRRFVTDQIVGWARGIIKDEKLEMMAIDYGYDPGVTNWLAFENLPVIGATFGKPKGWTDERYENFGTYMWALIRDAFMEERIGIVNDPVLISQLSSRRIERLPNGKIKLESKKGNKSPDRADACVLAWYARTCIISGDPIGKNDSKNAATELNEQIERVSNYTEENKEEKEVSSIEWDYDEEDSDSLNSHSHDARLESDRLKF